MTDQSNGIEPMVYQNKITIYSWGAGNAESILYCAVPYEIYRCDDLIDIN